MGCSWLLKTYFIKASNLLSKWIAAIKGSSHMLPRNEAFLAASWYSILSNKIQFWSVQIIYKIVNSVGCPRHHTIASKLLRIKTCLGGVFWVFHGILALFDIYEQRTGFLSREPDFQKILKKPQNMFSWCFLSVSCYFLALFDTWAEIRIFQPRIGFSKIS